MASIIGSVLGILVCGSLGGGIAWAVVGMLGLAGAAGAIVAAVIGMVVAVAAWAAGSVALRAAGWIK